jgi:hypothetical protein
MGSFKPKEDDELGKLIFELGRHLGTWLSDYEAEIFRVKITQYFERKYRITKAQRVWNWLLGR